MQCHLKRLLSREVKQRYSFPLCVAKTTRMKTPYLVPLIVVDKRLLEHQNHRLTPVTLSAYSKAHLEPLNG